MQDQPGGPETETTQQPSPRRRRNWTRIGLIASVALNLLLIGLFVGFGVRTADDRLMRGDGRAAQLLRMLPDRLHPEARAIMQAQRQDRAQDIRRMRAIHREAIAALRAEPFVPEDLDAALQARNDLRRQLTGPFGAVMLALTPEMTPEERAAIAERLERLADRWARRNPAPAPRE